MDIVRKEGNSGRKRSGGAALAAAAVRFFDLPPDVISGGLTLELRGREELLVGGCERILVYSEEYIKLALCREMLEVFGVGMSLTTYYGNSLGIEGRIDRICFTDDEGERGK